METIIIAHPNRAPDAALSGGAWSANAPVSNLQTRFSFERARSIDTDLSSTMVDAALDRARDVRFVALVRHNLSVVAKYRLRASSVAGDFSAALADTGWCDVWPGIMPFGAQVWGDDGWWGGKPTAEDIAGYPALLLVVLPESVRARYWRLELSDQANAAGYVEAARLWMSGEWQPLYNMSWGNSIAWEDASQVATALDRTEYFDEAVKTRVLRASLERLNHDEAHARFLEMTRQLGVTRELLVVPDANDAMHLIRRSFVGRLRQLSPVEAYAVGLYKGALEIKESV